jgi:hypothetical protein
LRFSEKGSNPYIEQGIPRNPENREKHEKRSKKWVFGGSGKRPENDTDGHEIAPLATYSKGLPLENCRRMS